MFPPFFLQHHAVNANYFPEANFSSTYYKTLQKQNWNILCFPHLRKKTTAFEGQKI